jgi:ABC-2 type transport system permease protein
MQAILTFLRKEFAQLRRDKNSLRLMLVSPILQLLIFGYAANLDVDNVDIVVNDRDNTVTSRELLSHFTHSGYFTVVGSVDNANEVDAYLDKGKATIALDIPAGFGDDILSGKQAQVQAIADGSESSAASVGLNYAASVLAGFSQQVLLTKFKRLGAGNLHPITIDPEVRVWYNPELKSRNFLIPGILAMLLMTMTTMLTSLAVVKEKELGTMDQLMVSPIKPYQLIIGKLTPFVIIGLIDTVLVLLGVTLWFGVPVRGSVLLLFGLTGLFLLTTLGLGLFVSTVSKTQQQAMMTSMFFVMMPMNFLSGFIFPIENMPKVIQAITYIIPLRYFFVIIRGLFLRGVGMEALWPQALALFVFGVGILTLSILRFRRKLS